MRIFKTMLAAAVCIGLSVCGIAAAHADEIGIPGVSFNGGDGSFKRAVQSGINLIISPDPPYTFQDDKTKQFDGLDVQIFREITKRLGIQKVNFDIVQFDSMIPSLIAKRADVIVDNLHENPKRLDVIAFTSPAYWYGSAVAVQKGNPKNIHTWKDFAGHVIGTVRGSINQQLLEPRKDIGELKLYTSNEAEFADLLAGRIDAAMEDGLKISQFIKQHSDAAMEFASGYQPQAVEYGYARYALRKDDVDLNHAVSRAIDEMRADGTLGKLLVDNGFSMRNLWYFTVSQ